MSMQDPLGDMLTRIRNAQRARHQEVRFGASRLKLAVAQVLQREGYVERVDQNEEKGRKSIRIELRYHQGQPVIQELARVSRPSLRRYSSAKDIPSVRNGYGVAIISTVKGVLSDREARSQNLGGEILATVF